MFDLSLQTANEVHGYANGALVVGALLVFVGTLAAIWTDKIREFHADIRISKNEADTASANAAAEVAKAEAAKANMSAATLQNEAAAANERAAQIMKATAWREIQPAQREMISSYLGRRAHKVRLIWIGNDPESLALAVQFSQLFASAHWEVVTSANTYYNNLIWGIWIPDSKQEGDATRVLREALTAAGIKFEAKDLPAANMMFGGGGAELATILVGSKMPTLGQPPN